jgi:hypothetical protein
MNEENFLLRIRELRLLQRRRDTHTRKGRKIYKDAKREKT